MTKEACPFNLNLFSMIEGESWRAGLRGWVLFESHRSAAFVYSPN